LKFRHFLIHNFTFAKIMVREGWIGQDGKKGEPRIQFQAIQYLQDVLHNFAKAIYRHGCGAERINS
jgi:DNA polymerase-3 subunit alpha